MEALDLTAPFKDLRQAALASQHSRLPVYEGNIDNIAGVLEMQTFLRELLKNPELSDLRPLVKPVLMVPASVTLDRLLALLQQDRSEMAIILDEAGGTAGVVTLADAVGEVFAHSPEDLYRRGAQGQVLVPGAIRLEQFNDLFGWDLDNEHVDHMSGFIMQELDRPAREGDVVECLEGLLRVERVSRLRILEVAVLTPDGANWKIGSD
jgi:CBS domain containing-hemolysin-like protein